MLHAHCVVQTVSLHKLASAMPTSVERDSNLRRSNLDRLPVRRGMGFPFEGWFTRFGRRLQNKVNIFA